MYRYTKTLKGVIGKYKNGDLADVKQITDLWEYLEGDFVDALYEEEWYNEGTNEPFPCPNGQLVTGNNSALKCTYVEYCNVDNDNFIPM